MTEREWKTGDVALVTFDNATGNQRAQGISRIETQVALVDANHVGGDAEPAEAWFVFGATRRIGATWESVREVRPLVVIDPEDREAVERLRASLESMSFSPWACGAATCLTAALREFANPKPPRPEEPTGLGAVVEDEDGSLLIRNAPTGDRPWVTMHGATFSWAEIDLARVLSEGVQP